jgi:GMP synthase (glutamine-hydrolysing)
MTHGFLILDFGSQLTQLIARRMRELGFYSELMRFDTPLEEIKKRKPKGIILSGGPSSVSEPDAPRRKVQELIDVAPVLGICYGMQLLAHELGGKVSPSEAKEYGSAKVQWTKPMGPWPIDQKVWMSHGDVVDQAPKGAEIVAWSANKHPAAMEGPRYWGVQFHPEVSHTEAGSEILKAFATKLCKAEKNWSSAYIADHALEMIKEKVKPGEKVLCGLSGGVDSTVTATLLTKALGRENVLCVFVDTGLLRLNEFQNVMTMYKELGLNVKGVDASEQFLTALKGIEDPEKKRKTIGATFIRVFEKHLPNKNTKDYVWLGQGTLYPDVIESVAPRGTTATIKSHHNVGGLPPDLKLQLIEPLRELFKDEVRALGRELGLPQKFLGRHPFPGPGLAIRILGEITPENLDILKKADNVFIEELNAQGLYNEIWQAFACLLPIRTVGVQGDGRTYDRVLALRAVTSVDGMTADWFAFDPKFLAHVSNRITNEVRGINRVVYDVTSKPPGTIEWE